MIDHVTRHPTLQHWVVAAVAPVAVAVLRVTAAMASPVPSNVAWATATPGSLAAPSPQGTREVAESVFELLHAAIVDYAVSSTPETPGKKEEVYFKLERLGFRVGQCLLERQTRDVPRFRDQLEAIKFICKDLWIVLFRKQIDNLRTNYRGVYVLHDNKFRMLAQMAKGAQFSDQASPYLAFTCGLVRGGLANLGISSVVTAEVTAMPACTFQIKVYTGEQAVAS